MFRSSTHEEYRTGSEGGVRHLFRLGPYEFGDTLDEGGDFHHFIREAAAEAEAEVALYEVDAETMYECMARFLAGEYEKAEYRVRPRCWRTRRRKGGSGALQSFSFQKAGRRPHHGL